MTPKDESTSVEARFSRDRSVDRMRLRILATTDLHMQLRGHDYVTDRPLGHAGLSSLATLIRDARNEAAAENAACLLVDNGDLLQGNPLGQRLAGQEPDRGHPVVATLNALAYDVIGLGNHDLDEGLDYLQALAMHLDMPVLSSNLKFHTETPLRRSVILRARTPSRGKDLQVGFLSVLPARTSIWNCRALVDRAVVTDPGTAIRNEVVALRGDGADLVILLAHVDLDDGEIPDNLPGVDAIVAGHTHQRIPGTGIPSQGRGLRQPRIMPGHEGSDLAVLDLHLDHRERWQVVTHQATLRANSKNVPPSPEIAALCEQEHTATLDLLGVQIGQSDQALHDFFALAMPCPIGRMLAQAKALAVQQALISPEDRALPLLGNAPARSAGQKGHFLHIPSGPILRRHLNGIAPHRDNVAALRINGAALRTWLERSAEIFVHLDHTTLEQPLVRADVPPFCFDTIYGLTYTIDPTKPAGQRIGALCYGKEPVDDEQFFILATNSFRASGGGGLLPDGVSEAPLHRSIDLQEALTSAISAGPSSDWPETPPWRFSVPQPVCANLVVASEALPFLEDLSAHFGVEVCAAAQDQLLLRLTIR